MNCNNDIVKSDRRKVFILPFAVQSIYSHHKFKFTALCYWVATAGQEMAGVSRFLKQFTCGLQTDSKV